MKVREALKKMHWEAVQNLQNEQWNVTDLLNEFQPGDSPTWLDRECVVDGGVIIDGDGDELREGE